MNKFVVPLVIATYVAYALRGSDLSGALNLVSPHPVTNAEYTATLARVLRRPAVLAVPRLAWPPSR